MHRPVLLGSSQFLLMELTKEALKCREKLETHLPVKHLAGNCGSRLRFTLSPCVSVLRLLLSYFLNQCACVSAEARPSAT